MRAFRLRLGMTRAILAVALLTLVLFGPEPLSVASGRAAGFSRERRIVNGWLAPWSMPASLASAERNADLWSEVSPFWYEATGPTTIALRHGAGDPAVVGALRRRGLVIIPTVTESLDSTALAKLLNNPARRAAHVRTLVALATANGYDGLDLDYEVMAWQGNPADRPAAARGFVRLLGDLGAALHQRDLKAEALRAHYHAKRQWSSVDAAPWFTYTTRAGVRHVVWYNDAASTRAKLGLVVNYHLRGLAFWVVGSEDARQWPAIRAFTGPPAAAHPKRPARGH